MVYNIENLTVPLLSDQKDVEELIQHLNLDDTDIQLSQFLVCKTGDGLVGVGRIRKHPDCLELCSLGVRQAHRGEGIGKALVKSLLSEQTKPVYIVTEIGDYFQKFGFEPSDQTIPSLIEKQRICLEKLACKKPVIMVKNYTA